MANWTFTKTANGTPTMTLWRNAARMRVPYPCVDSLKFESKTMDCGHQMAVAAAMSILTENIAQFKKPSDWWQAVKERWFPVAWLKRWPVRYDYIEVKALYPYATFKDQEIIWKVRKAA